jgi:hypothetical protein
VHRPVVGQRLHDVLKHLRGRRREQGGALPALGTRQNPVVHAGGCALCVIHRPGPGPLRAAPSNRHDRSMHNGASQYMPCGCL